MSNVDNVMKYDDVLTSILVNEKSIVGFLSTIFEFLSRRTDFYYVPEGPYENMGFPPGVAEELVVKILRKCDPKNWNTENNSPKVTTDLDNEIMCNTVAQEVEVVTEGEEINKEISETVENLQISSSSEDTKQAKKTEVPNKTDKIKPTGPPEDYKPPVIPAQKDSDTYNGAEREHYCWSQTIMDLDAIVKLPPDIKSSKLLKVVINSGDISITRGDGEVILKDSLPFKVKTIDCFWSVSAGKLLMHLEKAKERWWNRLLDSEEPIDLDKIDCSRPLDELPQDHIDKIRELQWNQDRKLKGLPTSDDIRNVEILKKAWNAEGSPFKGQEFDPSVLSNSSLQPQ